MLKSMTAYGRATLISGKGRFVAEIQSLNRKFQEISVMLPRELSSLETEIRKWVAARVLRGKITLRITASFEESNPMQVTPNLSLARQLKAAWEKIADELKIEERGITLEMLSKDPALFLYSEEFAQEELQEPIKEVVSKALDALIEMKVQEGKVISGEFKERIQMLRQALEKIRGMAQEGTKRYRERLKKNLEEVLPGAVENEERILREICVYAEKVDISEEITRLDSHLCQFLDFLNGNRNEKGKTLEFILQEMNRETNTIGSKSDEMEITKQVVEMKGEIEKIKEQVQNVE